MEYIEWKSAYELGFEQLDLQHKNLVALLNQLYDFIQKGSSIPKDNIQDILSSLVNYTVYHFDTEEDLMEQNGYENFKAHKIQHESFKQSITNYITIYELNDFDPIEIAEFLKLWLLNHIAKEDMKYVPLLKSKGVV